MKGKALNSSITALNSSITALNSSITCKYSKTSKNIHSPKRGCNSRKVAVCCCLICRKSETDREWGRVRNKVEEERKIEEKESDKDELEKQSLRILLMCANASQKRRLPFFFYETCNPQTKIKINHIFMNLKFQKLIILHIIYHFCSLSYRSED